MSDGSRPRTVLVTGATGFVGQALVPRLVRDGAWHVRAALRTALPDSGDQRTRTDAVVVGDIGADTEWTHALDGVDAVVHLAARVHVMRDVVTDPLAEFRRVNVEGTLALARSAAAAGVRRFVFVSSVKVNGEQGTFTERDAPRPGDPYGRSKHEAEMALRTLAERGPMDVVIVRPPLVYGPGVKANFRTLTRAVRRGLLLPLGSIANRRSLVAVDNLADFIAVVLDHPRAANETFFVSDGEDLSTPDLIRRLGEALGRPARLLPVPTLLLEAGAALVGKRETVSRLVNSLQVDIGKARTILGWTPPVTVRDALARAAR